MNLQAQEDALIESFSNAYRPDFADLPEHLKTTRVAGEWFSFMGDIDYDSESKAWRQIPLHLVTDDLRFTAIDLEPEIFQYISPDDTDRYLDLFFKAHNRTFLATQYLHPNFRNTETVGVMMASGEFERSYWDNRWIAEVMTADQVESASRMSAKIMVKLPVEQISAKALSIHLTDSFWAYGLMRTEGKLRVAADFMRSDRWPESANPFESGKREPESVAQAVDLLMDTTAHNTQAVYMAHLMNQPFEDVMALMTTRQHIKLAIEMYTEAELRPLMKNNRLLKAALLEESLGL
jgi:hypothetical protein